MGMSATETEMKAQNVKSGIGFQIVQNEKQLFLVRIKITFRTALFDVFYLALFDTLSIDGESGRLEYFDEGCELRLGHSNQRCHDAVIGYLAKFVVDHGRFLYSDLFEKQVGYQYHALASGTTLLNKQIKRRDMAITANEDVSIFLYLTKETTSGYKENIIKQRNSFTPYFTTAHPSDWAHSPKQSQV
ncbi:protein of unknown function [Methylocaldum szegediense]|uniref:Uncharacterized protein n=1 Tax=Methylocaldum szegediense TaxID=73780 RepID=A0ABN8X527_9GAMM|nr:protein of unknown function [Methylocaldum szegediense]